MKKASEDLDQLVTQCIVVYLWRFKDHYSGRRDNDRSDLGESIAELRVLFLSQSLGAVMQN